MIVNKNKNRFSTKKAQESNITYNTVLLVDIELITRVGDLNVFNMRSKKKN